VSAAGGTVRADLSFSAGSAEGPAASLQEGLESRITFTLRCYEHRTGLLGLLGDQLLAQRTVVRVAFYDVLDRRFVVEQDGERTSYDDEAGFLDAFFALRGLELVPAGACYVAARAQYDPVRLSPPLTILTLFGVAARFTTPWVRRDVPEAMP
jgi:hypothetical protein